MTSVRFVAAAALLGLSTVMTPAGARAVAPQPSRYILIAAESAFPPDLDEQVSDAGGWLTLRLPDIGVAVANSFDSGFASGASSIPGLRSVVRDVVLALDSATSVATIGNPPTSGDDDSLFDMQWALDAIDAPEAWALGFRGAGVRVAVLDTGIDIHHPDLAPNLNLALSTSLIPGVGLEPPAGTPSFVAPAHHGTWVAGIIAAADNGIGTIGVAPEAEIVAFRVCFDDGRCVVSAILAGLVHAARIDADVINMSLAYYLPRRGFTDADGNYISARDAAELYVAWTRALQFAAQRGATTIEGVGNSAIDLDGNGDVQSSVQAPGVIGVAATAPRGWALDPTTSLDLTAPYTNYGQSAVDIAAPGGYLDVDALMSPPWTFCTVVVTLPCFIFDLVVGTTAGGWSLNFGTSAATPHVSGVAALVIGAHGGRMHPDAVKAVLQASADDLGKPGVDDFYGHGRVNAATAVQVR
jgi:lantibiotic leader peptide-processing serine protease